MTDDQRGVSASGKLAGGESPVTWMWKCPRCGVAVSQTKLAPWHCACGRRER
jgi:hypothetical protein